MRTAYLTAAIALCTSLGAAQNQQLDLQSITFPLDRPTAALPVPGQSSMYIVAGQGGVIRAMSDSGPQLVQPFLDLSSLVFDTPIAGLTGMAFDPDYVNNRRFFVRYNWDAGGQQVKAVVEEYTVPASTPFQANPVPVQRLVVVDLIPDINGVYHHGTGALHFGPDGMLYCGVGDSAKPGDFAGGLIAQDTFSRLGKILRLDTDAPPSFEPANNPFAGGVGGDPLVWAYGLRNPHGFSFDALTGELFIGDVGNLQNEELDREPNSSPGGENYGWPCLEGTFVSAPAMSEPICQGLSSVGPWFEYPHGVNSGAVIGGYVYRGTRMPWLYGHYLYADFVGATLKALDVSLANPTSADEIDLTIDLDLASSFNGFDLVGVVPDENGEPLIIKQTASSGRLFRVVPQSDYSDFDSFCPGNPNITGSPGVLTATGSPVISDNATNPVVLTSSSCPPGALSQFIYGADRTDAVLSNGRLCIGSPIRRIDPVGVIQPNGTRTHTLDLPNLPEPIVLASTWYFQLWHRDGAGASNLTGGLWIVFEP
ncbi:MAG: PQQ-dependent sugar dehydrogenase [bacterium]|nr:PQQ-dependent sugar dehydrogenase [bacterium]